MGVLVVEGRGGGAGDEEQVAGGLDADGRRVGHVGDAGGLGVDFADAGVGGGGAEGGAARGHGMLLGVYGVGMLRRIGARGKRPARSRRFADSCHRLGQSAAAQQAQPAATINAAGKAWLAGAPKSSMLLDGKPEIHRRSGSGVRRDGRRDPPGGASPGRGPHATRTVTAMGVSRAFSDDIAIDLGTANTLVHVVGRGIIIDEPSVVAVQVRGGERVMLAVGLRAKAMQGKTPEPVEIVRPMRDGMIADFIATEEMLRQFIARAKSMLGFRRPRILICVPAGATPVERRAVYETAVAAGARKVYLIEEPVAASLGAGLPIDGPSAFMVVDIGGGTTDVAVLHRGQVVQARSLRVAGNAMDEAIVRYVRRQHGLVIGKSNAERIKSRPAAPSCSPTAGSWRSTSRAAI